MKRNSMRFLAFMLVAVMVVCMTPLASAEGETVGEMSGVKVVYSLKSPTEAQVQLPTVDYIATKGFWKYHSVAKEYEANAYKVATKDYLSCYSYGANNGYVALMIDVPVKGKYDVILNYCSNTDGVESGTVHIIPATVTDIKSAIDSGNYLAVSDINYYSASKKTGNVASGSCTIENTGEHYLVFSQSNEYNSSKAVIRPEAIILDGGNDVVPMISSIAATPGENGGATVAADAALMSDGTVASNVTYSYSVAEDDMKIASVDTTTGVVKGFVNGVATIIATATSGDYSSSKSIEVSVENPNMSGVKVVYSMEVATVSNGDPLDSVNYSDTNGFWAFAGKYNNPTVERNIVYGTIVYPNAGAWWAIKMNIPKAGLYSLKLDRGLRPQGGLAFFYFGEESKGATEIVKGEKIAEEKFYATADVPSEETDVLGVVDVKAAGEYILVIRTPSVADFTAAGLDSGKRRHFIKKIILDGGTNTVPMISDITATAENDVTTVKATSTLMSDATTTVTDATITYSVAADDAKIAAVDANTGVVTAKSTGIATIIATATKGDFSSSRSIEVSVIAPEAGEEITNSNVSISVMPSVKEGGTVSGLDNVINSVKMGTIVNLTAVANEGYEFKFWKNASGQVLSDKEEHSFVVNTNSAITAVFDRITDDEDAVSVELYNANGMQLFANDAVKKNTSFVSAIADAATPTYTGLGTFKHWSMYADGSKIDDDMPITKNTRAVAIFNEPTKKYNVEVNNVEKFSDVLYGTEVTVTSIAEDFSCWKLGDEIVSYDKSYTFAVWNDVNITEVTGESVEKAPVVVLDEVEGNPLLIYSVPAGYTKIEAGLIFGTSKSITISSVDGSRASEIMGTGQFTAQPKDAEKAVARGYLIFKTPTGEVRVLYAD